MAWDLDRHMHQYIAPTVWKAAESKEDGILWLTGIYADQRWDESTGQAGYDALLEEALDRHSEAGLLLAVCEAAQEAGMTTNGGWRLYLDSRCLHAIEWCSEDEMLAWTA